MSDPTEVSFIQHLSDKDRAIYLLYEEHIQTYNEVLPHVFMAEMASAFIDAINERAHRNDWLDIALLELDKGCRSSGVVQNLICVSFLWNFFEEYDAVAYIMSKGYGSLNQCIYQMARDGYVLFRDG